MLFVCHNSVQHGFPEYFGTEIIELTSVHFIDTAFKETNASRNFASWQDLPDNYFDAVVPVNCGIYNFITMKPKNNA